MFEVFLAKELHYYNHLRYNTPIANSIEDREVCDNNLDGNDSNGQITTNLLDINTLVLGNQNATDYTITYHSSQSDADTRLNNLTALTTVSTSVRDCFFNS